MAMPVMDGPAAIFALQPIKPDIKIIASSGLSTDGGAGELKIPGVKQFIPKPYTADTMLDALYTVLHNHAEK